MITWSVRGWTVMFGLAIPALLAAGHSWAAPPPKAALVHAGLPGENPALVAALEEELRSAGYDVTEFDAEALCDASKLDAAQVDLLVLPNAASLPAGSAASIKAYAEAGGDILALNAPLWRETLVNPKGAWVTREQYERESAALLPEHVLFGFAPEEIAGWQRAFFPPEAKAAYETVAEGPAPGQRALRGRVADLRNWDNFGPAKIDGAFPDGHTLTVFSAKGAEPTRALSVEWQERDGSRWIATVPLGNEWRRYVLKPEDFKYWESVPARVGTVFDPKNAASLHIGMAFTHTGTTPGAQEWWVGPFGTAAMNDEYARTLAGPSIPAMDTLAPGYKFFACGEVAHLRAHADQAAIADAVFDVPAAIRSPQPRPGGAGFQKGRTWRWIPLIEATTASGEWRGTPATLTVHSRGDFGGGQWAAFGVNDPEWYLKPAVRAALGQVARTMRRGVYLMDGGANFYTYFADQPLLLGARVANVGRENAARLEAKVIVADGGTGKEVYAKEWTIDVPAGEEKSVSESWEPAQWPKAGFRVTAQLIEEGRVVDRAVAEAHVWKPKEKKSFVTVKNGDFMLRGKRWRANGVNYMPSSGIGTEDGRYFESWMGARSYDPEIIERDLRHMEDIGLNAVSIFIYREAVEAQNLLDLLRRLDNHGLKANLSLRPGTIGNFQWPNMLAIIQYYKLWEHDAVFAYDLDWEPMWLTHKERVKWDKDWEAWIVERYGSLENAERDWGFPVPRDEERGAGCQPARQADSLPHEAGRVTNPEGKQLLEDGPWRAMAAAYRRCMDTLLYKHYGEMRDLVHAVCPNQFVSFRMTEAGDPTMNWGEVMPYDFPYLASAVDMLEPEAYGRIGDWEKIKPAWFEYEYARWAAPRKPMFWAEGGVHAWDVALGDSSPALLERQGKFYRDFYRMLISSGADGIFWWWYPGGFRTGENSDYGLINPDGSDRPSTRAIRENTARFLHGPSAKPVNYWLEFDRDTYPNGIAGVYNVVKDQFWKAIDDGRTPGLRTAGTGTNSAMCPLVAVGNTPCNGSNPAKYLDGFFDKVEVLDRKGHWVKVAQGESIEVDGSRPVRARIAATNLGEAEWLDAGPGGVHVTALTPEPVSTPLPKRVPHMGSAVVPEVALTRKAIAQPTEATITFLAEGRTAFGEKFRVTLVP